MLLVIVWFPFYIIHGIIVRLVNKWKELEPKREEEKIKLADEYLQKHSLGCGDTSSEPIKVTIEQSIKENIPNTFNLRREK